MEAKVSKCEIITESDKYLAKKINDIEEYKNILFQDWDFLDVPILFKIYKANPDVFKDLTGVDLEYYTDLMPEDIKEEFYLMSKNSTVSTQVDIEEYVISCIYNTLQRLMRKPRQIQNISEDELSDHIATALEQAFQEKNIIIEREARGGFSLKETGELDFYIYTNINGVLQIIAIGENKEWPNFLASINQLIGYSDTNVPFGFTIIFNKTAQLSTVLERRIEILKTFSLQNSDFEIIGNVEDVPNLADTIKTKHKNPEKEGTLFPIYHFVINAYLPQREEAARRARKKSVKEQIRI